MRNIKPLVGICGLYFIFLKETEIPYPFGKSRLIYIGMSEKKTNSIGKRLSGHYDGASGNEGLQLREKIVQLERNSQNSSKPPSSDNPKERYQKDTRHNKSKRRAGGQLGHQGTYRQLIPVEEVDKVIPLYTLVIRRYHSNHHNARFLL